MKIAYIINSLEGGGAALPIPDIARLLVSKGHRLVVIGLMRRDGRAIAPIKAMGCDVIVREGGSKDHLHALFWLNKTLSTLEPDLIWTSLTRATLLGQLVGAWRKLPVVSWQHSARLKPINAWLLRKMRRRSLLWIADSQCVSDETRSKLAVAPQNLICWPIFRASADTAPAPRYQEGDVFHIGALGRLHPVKNFMSICDAARLLRDRPELPPIRFTIAGEGAERDALAMRIAAEALPIDLIGYIEQPAIFLRRLHLYVQPSLWEGFCLAAHEAMLCELPVIVSARGEMQYTVTPACGRALPSPSGPALAAAIEELLGQRSQLKIMGRVGRNRVLENFGPTRFDLNGQNVLRRIEGLLKAKL